jgi:hypothetical protein
MRGAKRWTFLMVGGPHHGNWMTFNSYAIEDMYEMGYHYVPDPIPMTYERYEDTFNVPPVTMYVLRRFDTATRDGGSAYIRVLVARAAMPEDGWLVSDAMKMAVGM